MEWFTPREFTSNTIYLLYYSILLLFFQIFIGDWPQTSIQESVFDCEFSLNLNVSLSSWILFQNKIMDPILSPLEVKWNHRWSKCNENWRQLDSRRKPTIQRWKAGRDGFLNIYLFFFLFRFKWYISPTAPRLSQGC